MRFADKRLYVLVSVSNLKVPYGLIHPNFACVSTSAGGKYKICINQLRYQVDYVLYYLNIARTMVTAVIPLVALVSLNLLVYKYLVKRRAFTIRHTSKYSLRIKICQSFLSKWCP